VRSRPLRGALAALSLALATPPAGAQLAPDAEAFVRKTYLDRARAIRVEAGAEELSVDLVPGGFRSPRRPPGAVLFRPGEVVRVGEVSSAGRSVVFRFSSPDRSAAGAVRFVFPAAGGPLLARGEELLAAAAAVFDPLVRLGGAPEEEPGEKPEGELAPGDEPPAEPEETPEAGPPAEELRLLVEPGRSRLTGDGDDTTTLTITLRDADGRIVENRNGPVEVRMTCGRLVPERPVMLRGRAVANLTAPIWNDEDRTLDRSIELSVAVMRRLSRSGVDARTAAVQAAREAPYGELRSTAQGHRPEILVVAEAFGVKGKARVELGPSATPRAGVWGTYVGKDVLGATEWIFEGSLAQGVLRQRGSPEEVPVRLSRETGGMGFVGVSVGGMGSSARPLPGGRFFLVAPPILFERVSVATAAGPAPKEEKKPTATLTARTNPIAADGKSTTELLFQYLDETGRPVPGLLLEWSLDRYGVFPGGGKGELLSSQPRADGEGTARAVYRAPTLEAGDMQQTGSVRNRDVTVTWDGPKGKGSVTSQVGLLRAASLVLVVEKPGVERAVFPLRVGSLNGTITGTVLLENVPPRMPGAPARLPLADAVVRLDGDQKVLKWAAVDDGRTDAKGRFRIRMRMSNWERWDKAFEEPLVVRASDLFLGRLSQCRRHLDQWPASREVLLEKLEFPYRAQEELARLPAAEARGLDEKLRLTGLLVIALKDARKDGAVAARELLTHGKGFLVGVASWFYADSRLEKAVNDKLKALEGSAGVRELRQKYARWLHGAGAERARRVLAWLAAKVGLGADLPKDALGARSAFRRVLVPKLLEALAGAIAEWTPETSLGELAVETMLSPYVERGNRVLLAFLRNRDYRLVASTAATSGAHLSVHLGQMSREVQRVAEWRLSEDTAKAFLDAGTEWVTLSMKVAAALTLNEAVWKAATAIEKGKAKLDTGIAAIRMGEEWHRLSGILAATEEAARECVVLSAGITLPVAAGGLPADDGPLLAGLFSFGPERGEAAPDLGALFRPRGAPRGEGVDLDVRLLLARRVSDAWLVESLPALLALKESRGDGVAAFERALRGWESAVDEGFRDLRAAGAGIATRREDEVEASLAAAASEWTAKAAEAIEAARGLPPDDGLGRLAEAERRGGSRLLRLEVPVLLAAGAALLLFAGLAASAAVALRRRAARPAGEPRRRAAVPRGRPRVGPGAAVAGPPRLSLGGGEVRLLDHDVLTIGAAPGNDLVVPFPGVSRAHARILRDGAGAFWLEDAGSRYGTKVNGRAVRRVRLAHGDEIAAGSWRASFRLD
jgi:hypothetical protein